MLRKKDRPFFFTDKQMEQLRRTNGTLRQLNRDVRRELRGIEAHLTDKQYREAGLLLGHLASRMISVLRLREYVLNSGQEQAPTKCELVIEIVCNDFDCVSACDARDVPRISDQVPEIDPAHLPELDKLVEIAHNVGERVWLCFEPRTPPDPFLVGLKRLTDALLKQRRHLVDIAPDLAAAKCELIIGSTCCVCHKPIEELDPDPNALICGNDLTN